MAEDHKDTSEEDHKEEDLGQEAMTEEKEEAKTEDILEQDHKEDHSTKDKATAKTEDNSKTFNITIKDPSISE